MAGIALIYFIAAILSLPSQVVNLPEISSSISSEQAVNVGLGQNPAASAAQRQA